MGYLQHKKDCVGYLVKATANETFTGALSGNSWSVFRGHIGPALNVEGVRDTRGQLGGPTDTTYTLHTHTHTHTSPPHKPLPFPSLMSTEDTQSPRTYTHSNKIRTTKQLAGQTLHSPDAFWRWHFVVCHHFHALHQDRTTGVKPLGSE